MASRSTRSKSDKDSKSYSTRSRTRSKDDNNQKDKSSRRNRDSSVSRRDKNDKDNESNNDNAKEGSSVEQKSSVKSRLSVKDRLGIKNKSNDSKVKDKEGSLDEKESSVKGRLSVKDRLGMGRKTDKDKERIYSREKKDVSPRSKSKINDSLERKGPKKDRNKSKSPENRDSRRSKGRSESSRRSRLDRDDSSSRTRTSRESSHRAERRSTRIRKDSEQSTSSRKRSKSTESRLRSSERSRPSPRNTETENAQKDIEKEKCVEKEDEIAPASRVDSACDKFDAKFAIYSDVPIPYVDQSEIKSFDTIEDCIKEFNTERRAMKERGVESVETEGVVLPKLERCFAPEQMMVPTSRGKKFRDVNTRMERFRGPLAQLREWRENKVRVKVWTRGLDQIRGTATAFIAAFDKHWNLALTDVDEQFSRLRQRKTWCPERKLKRKLLPADLPVEYEIGNSRMRVVKIQGMLVNVVK